MVKAGDMGALILAIAVASIVGSIGADIVTGIRDDQTADTHSYNASTDGLDGITEFTSWFDTIALVLAAVVVLGYLLFLR